MYNYRSRGGYTPSSFSYEDFLKQNFWGGKEPEIVNQYIKECPSYLVANNSTINKRFGDYTLQTKENRDFIKEASLYFVHKLYETEQYMKDEYVDIDLETIQDSKVRDIIAKKKNIFDGLEGKDIPGVTPLDQAVYLFFSILDGDETGKAKKDIMNLSEEEAQNLVRKVNSQEEDLYDKDLEELMKKNYRSLKEKALKTLNKLALVKNFGSEFKVHLEIEEEYCFNGPIPAKKLLVNYSDIVNIDLYQFFMPDFNTRLATKNLVCNVRTKKTDHKQKIVMLIDYSGSMSSDYKQEWVATLLLDRLKYVMKGEAELFIMGYETKVMDLHHVYDRQTAIAFWNQYSFQANLGGTEAGKCINSVKKQIDSGNFFNLGIDLSKERPEILLIHDGQIGLAI